MASAKSFRSSGNWPGAKSIEKSPLPDAAGFDAPDRLDAFLDAVRWGAASTADLKNIQSPFRSGIDIEDYQLDPVVRAIQMPRVNLLIADDVGLGKTIEAGMTVSELIIRHRARRVLGPSVAKQCGVYLWPLPNRATDNNGKAGILQVKCAVADATWLFLSSANLTEYAFSLNMELGLLISGGNLPAQVEAHFDRMIQTGVPATP